MAGISLHTKVSPATQVFTEERLEREELLSSTSVHLDFPLLRAFGLVSAKRGDTCVMPGTQPSDSISVEEGEPFGGEFSLEALAVLLSLGSQSSSEQARWRHEAVLCIHVVFVAVEYGSLFELNG